MKAAAEESPIGSTVRYMGVTPDGLVTPDWWVTPDTQLRAYITKESCMVDILILRKEDPEIRIPLCQV